MHDPCDEFGLVANGSSGAFAVELDESLGGPEAYYLDIQTRGWSFQFRVPDRFSITGIRDFLRDHSGRTTMAEFVAGSFIGAPVLFIKDAEFSDRFFLRASGYSNCVDFILVDNDAAHLIAALGQAIEDL